MDRKWVSLEIRIPHDRINLTIKPTGAQNHDKSERDLHKNSDEHDQGNAEAMEIDLKCAEKVTDSDVESNADDKVS